MKTIGIIGAMAEEISFLKSKMEIVATKKVVDLEYYIGRHMSKNIVLVQCGIGKVNAAVCATSMIDLLGVDIVINIGVAGALHSDLNIGDIVVSSDLVQHDFNCITYGYDLGIIPRMEESFFQADAELVQAAKEAGEALFEDKNIMVGRIASGDQFVSAKEVKNKIWSNFKAYCVEMEGAAIAQACYLNKVPFVVIRAISDKADESATVSFDQFVQQAAQNSSDLVEKMLEVL